MIKQLLLEALERLATGFFVGIGFCVAAAVVFTLWAIPAPAWGDELRAYGGGYSKHLVTGGDSYNESHDLFAVQYGPAVAGRFNNSHGRESYFAAYEWNWRPVDSLPDLQTFAWAGVVHGYASCTFDGGKGNGRLCALAVGGVRYTRWRLEPVFMMVGEAATVAAAWRF